MNDICGRVYVRMYHQLSCAGTPIELYLVTSGLNPRVITGKTYGTVNKTSIS